MGRISLYTEVKIKQTIFFITINQIQNLLFESIQRGYPVLRYFGGVLTVLNSDSSQGELLLCLVLVYECMYNHKGDLKRRRNGGGENYMGLRRHAYTSTIY